MVFKLGIVGHADSLRGITDVVHKNFRDMEIYAVEFNNDDAIEDALVNIMKIINICDGILYTRIDPYKLISERIEHTIPTRYIEINASHLIISLAKTMYGTKGSDITKISIDTLDYGTIAGAYATLGIDSASLKIIMVDVDVNIQSFVNKAEEEHSYNYVNNLSSLCITSITSVYNNLLKKNIPCALLTPTAEAYVYEIRNLKLSHKLNRVYKNQTLVILISISPKDSFYYYSENQYKEILETHRAGEQIALFSQKLDGALIPVSDNRYVIICGSSIAEIVTSNYTNIDLLSNISRETMFNVSIGIGYGESVRVARRNAVTGITRAANEKGDKAYVVYDQHSVIGPIEHALTDSDSNEPNGKNLAEVAERCGLGVNTIYKIQCIIEQKKTSRFTSAELAEALGITIRTTNRVIAKLEEGGYASQVGKQPVGQRGRPGRVFRFIF